MQLEYELTLDDFREMSEVHGKQATLDQGKKVGGFIGWVVLVVLCGFLIGSAVEQIKRAENAQLPDPRSLQSDVVMPICVAIVCILLTQCIEIVLALAAGRSIRNPLKTLLRWTLLVGIFVSVVVLMQQTSDEQITSPSNSSAWDSWKFIIFALFAPHLTWIIFYFCFSISIAFTKEKRVQKAWQDQPHLAQPHTFELKEEGIRVSSALSTLDYKWYALRQFRETPNLFLIYTSKLAMHIVPKRAFADATELNEFRQIMTNHINNRPVAFPVVKIGTDNADAAS